MFAYAIELTPDDNGTVMVTAPDFPEVVTFGDTEAEAIEHASDAIVEAIAARMVDNEDIPVPTPANVAAVIPSRVAMKVLVYNAMRRHNITKYRLMKMLDAHQPQVDRLLDVRHNTNLDMMDRAMSALDETFVIAAREVGKRQRNHVEG